MSLLQTLRNDSVTAWAGLLVLGVVTGIASAYTFDIEQPRGQTSGLVRLYAPGLIYGSALGLYLLIVKESKWWIAALFALSVVVSWRLALLVVIDQSWTPFWAGATGAAGMAVAAAVLFRALRSPWRLLSLVATGAVTGDLGLRITQSMDDWSGLFALWQAAAGVGARLRTIPRKVEAGHSRACRVRGRPPRGGRGRSFPESAIRPERR